MVSYENVKFIRLSGYDLTSHLAAQSMIADIPFQQPKKNRAPHTDKYAFQKISPDLLGPGKNRDCFLQELLYHRLNAL